MDKRVQCNRCNTYYSVNSTTFNPICPECRHQQTMKDLTKNRDKQEYSVSWPTTEWNNTNWRS